MKKLILILTILFSVTNVFAVDKNIFYTNLATGKSITIKYGDNNINAFLEWRSIDIDNLGSYYQVFQTGDYTNYPRYIIEKEGTYSFSDVNDGNSNSYLQADQIVNLNSNDKNKINNSCNNVLGASFINLLKTNVFKILYIAIPIMLLVYSTFDFCKVVFADEKDGVNKSIKNLLRRSLVAILIYFVPTILIAVLEIAGVPEIESCVQTFKDTSLVD